MTYLDPVYEVLKSSPSSNAPNENALQSQFDKIATLIEQEKITEAASTIEKIFAKGVLDIRLLAYYFYAHFFNEGVKSFSEVFPLTVTILTEHWEKVKPVNRKDKQVQNSLNWLILHLINKLKYAEKHSKNGEMHPIWSMSTVDISKEEMERAIMRLTEFKDFFHERWPKSSTGERVMHLMQMLNSISHLVPEETPALEEAPSESIVEAVEEILTENDTETPSELSSEETDNVQATSDVPFSPDPNGSSDDASPHYTLSQEESGQGSECLQASSCAALASTDQAPMAQHIIQSAASELSITPQGDPDDIGNPHKQGEKCLIPSEKMQELFEKLNVFEMLIQKNDHVKAALVAKDIDHLIENFDPLVYFPMLFSNYFSLMARNAAALSEQWENKQSLQSKYLEKLYATDLDQFIKW